MQFKNKIIKQFVSCFLVLMALWVAVPRVYVHDLLDHNHSAIAHNATTQVNTQSTDDCDFDQYNKPAYFNVFKFISSFLPLKVPGTQPEKKRAFIYSSFSYAVSLFRGPPSAL
jgi:hypothetical protein